MTIALREELPQKLAGILVGPVFPWVLRSGEKEWYQVQLFAEPGMPGEFLTAIRRDGRVGLLLGDRGNVLACGIAAKLVPALS